MKLWVEFEKGTFECVSVRGFRVVEQKEKYGVVLMAELKGCKEGYTHVPVEMIRGASTY